MIASPRRSSSLDADYRKQSASLRRAKLIDYRAVSAHKRRVLEPLAKAFFDSGADRSAEYKAFLKDMPEVRTYARFRAVGEKLDAPWQDWPERLRNGAIRKGDFRPEDERYHLYAQFAMHQQLGAFSAEMAERGAKLYLDLPVGTHASGYDIWKNRHVFMTGATVGAPPDSAFENGQNWGFPPMHPEGSTARGLRLLHRLAAQPPQTRPLPAPRPRHVLLPPVHDPRRHGRSRRRLRRLRARGTLRDPLHRVAPRPVPPHRREPRHRAARDRDPRWRSTASACSTSGSSACAPRARRNSPPRSRPSKPTAPASLNTHDLPPFAMDLMAAMSRSTSARPAARRRHSTARPRTGPTAPHALADLLVKKGYCAAKPSASQLAAGFNRYIAESDAEPRAREHRRFLGRDPARRTSPAPAPSTRTGAASWR